MLDGLIFVLVVLVVVFVALGLLNYAAPALKIDADGMAIIRTVVVVAAVIYVLLWFRQTVLPSLTGALHRH